MKSSAKNEKIMVKKKIKKKKNRTGTNFVGFIYVVEQIFFTLSQLGIEPRTSQGSRSVLVYI